MPYSCVYLIAKEMIKIDLKSLCFLFWKIKYLVYRIDFTPIKSHRVSIFDIKKQVNLIETLIIKLISCCNLQYIKTQLWQLNWAKFLKAKIFIFFFFKWSLKKFSIEIHKGIFL